MDSLSWGQVKSFRDVSVGTETAEGMADLMFSRMKGQYIQSGGSASAIDNAEEYIRSKLIERIEMIVECEYDFEKLDGMIKDKQEEENLESAKGINKLLNG